MEDLLSTHPAFMVGRWLKEARSFRKYKAEKDICEWNARVLVTWWGPDNPHTTLRDYANKEWSGLIKDYYYPRWKFFLESLRWHLMGLDAIEINYFSFEKNWSNQRKKYPVKPSGDCVAKSRSVLKKLEKFQHATLVRR
jgi:alpha-N-acetylglucosaminidase